ncbi:MAG: hypothetical protein ACI4P8_07165 [Akkermansia sp.]
MWQANKGPVVALLGGLLVLGGLHLLLRDTDELLARRVLSTGICLLLAVVGLYSWFSARRG